MRHFHKQKNHYHCPIVNLDKLWTLVGEEVSLDIASALSSSSRSSSSSSSTATGKGSSSPASPMVRGLVQRGAPLLSLEAQQMVQS